MVEFQKIIYIAIIRIKQCLERQSISKYLEYPDTFGLVSWCDSHKDFVFKSRNCCNSI